MGQHHNFARLKIHARKSYGMHQGALIRKVADSGFQDADICKAVQKGICGTLVTYWVKDILKGRESSLFVPPPKEGEGVGPDTFKARRDFRHMIIAGVCMPDQLRYNKLRSEGDQRPALLILSPEGVDAKVKGGDRAFGDLVGFNFKEDAAYYITLVCKSARHAIGICGSHGSGFTFFDPNAGEYEVPGVLFDRFLSEYRTILEKTLHFGEIGSVVISKATLART